MNPTSLQKSENRHLALILGKCWSVDLGQRPSREAAGPVPATLPGFLPCDLTGSPVSAPLTPPGLAPWTCVLEDGVCGRAGVVAVEKQALVHADEPAALPQVFVEEQQVLGDTLRDERNVSPLTTEPHSGDGRRGSVQHPMPCLSLA